MPKYSSKQFRGTPEAPVQSKRHANHTSYPKYLIYCCGFRLVGLSGVSLASSISFLIPRLFCYICVCSGLNLSLMCWKILYGSPSLPQVNASMFNCFSSGHV